MQDYVLGTDIGTGSAKTVALDVSGRIVHSTQYYYPTQHPRPGYSEQDPDEIFRAFIKSIRETVRKMEGPPLVISLSSAMHSVVAVDQQGSPLSNLLLWSDSRSSAIAERIKNSEQGRSIYNATGTPVHSMSPLSKLIWIRENLPEVFRQTDKFISIKEYIWYRLFGEYAIDHSLASATGLFAIEQLEWNQESLSLAGITEKTLSLPVATRYMRKGLPVDLAADLHIPADTAFCIGASDGCLANLGTHSLRPGTAAITIGTSGAVRIARDRPFRDYSIMSFNYLLDEETFICGGPVNNGGNVLQWLLQNFLLKKTLATDDYREIFERIEKVPAGSDGLLFLPYLNGERAPLWDQQASGAFLGLRSFHDQSHFLRAGIEGICFALLHILEAVEDRSRPVGQLNASGGMVHSGTWMQLLADITGRKIGIQQTEDASAVGAAYLALKALGIISSYSHLQQETSFLHPRKELQEAYQKKYGVFKTLYPLLKEAMHSLHDNGDSQAG